MHPSCSFAARRFAAAAVKPAPTVRGSSSETDALLRDVAFVLHLTRQVKQAIHREAAASN